MSAPAARPGARPPPSARPPPGPAPTPEAPARTGPAAAQGAPAPRPVAYGPRSEARYAWSRGVPATASIARRAAAYAVDASVVFALAWAVTFTAASLDLLRIPDLDVFGERNEAAGLLWIVSIFELPLLLAYFTLFEGRAGRTPGKALLGLRVVRVDDRPAGWGDAFLRNLLRLLWVTPFGPLFVLLDLWSLRSTELDQRMGDLAAGTLVLDDRLRVA